MNLSMLLYGSFLLLASTEIGATNTEQTGSLENGLVAFTKDGQRISHFAYPLDSEAGLEVSGHEPLGSTGKSMRNHLLSQNEFPLLIGDHFARQIPYGSLPSKYLLKPIRELTVANSLLNRGDETLRARRYAYPQSSQSFLRFGRRYKRPRDTKDTAFLRFGRNRPLGASATGEENSAVETNDAPSGFQESS